MTKRNAINLLLFMCCGISLDNNKSEVDLLKAMIDKAYGDASRHVLSIKDDKICKVKVKNPNIYETLKTKSLNYKIDDIDDKKLLKDTLREIASEYIIRDISNLKSNIDKSETKREEFNKWHKKLCEELCNLYGCCEEYYKIDSKGNKRPFTCGIAQKWVNMTIKHIVISYSLIDFFDDDNSEHLKKLYGKIEPFYQYLHIPIDNYILQSVFKSLKEKSEGIGKTFKERFKICKDGDTYKIKDKDSKKTYVWSKISIDDYDFYRDLQEKLREDKDDPLEWENSEWIKIAVKRKK